MGAFVRRGAIGYTMRDFTTLHLLADRYERRPIIPLEEVRSDWFPHLTKEMFARKISSRDIPLPVIRIEPSQKAPRGVHLRDLAEYIDARRSEALSVQGER